MAETEKILLQLELDVSQTITNLEKAKAALSTFKTEQATLNAELKKLEDAGQKGSVAFQNLERQLVANKAAQQNATVEVRNYEKQLRLAVAANEAQIGSNDQLKAQLSILTAEWNALSAAGRGNTEEGKNLQRAIQETTDKLNDQEQSVDNFKRQVGNYGIAAKGLSQQIKEATREATLITQKFGENSAQAIDSAKKVAALTEEYDDFKKRVAAFNPDNRFAVFGQVAQGIAGGFAAAQGAMAIFGDQSEAIGQTLVKLQSALALSQGIKQVAELGDSFKSLRLVIFGASAAKEVDTVATQTNAAAQVEGAVAAETLAVGEETATVATGGLSTAIKFLLASSGLILIPIAVNAMTDAFDIFGTNAKQSINSVIDSLDAEDKAHKANIEDIKATINVQTTELENAIAIAKAKGASIDDITKKETELRNKRIDGLKNERVENNEHLRTLLAAQEQFSNEKIQGLSGDLLKEAQEKRKANDEDIRATKLKNNELIVEETKLHAEIQTIAIDADQKRLEEENSLSNLRINLIKSDHQREVEQIKQTGKEKLDAIKDDEDNAAEKRILIAQETEQKIAESNRVFALKSLQERNQLAIALTREGTLERIGAEIKGATTERDELLNNTKLTETQRQLIMADTVNKVRELEDQRLGIIEQHNQQEVDLELRKQQAKVAIQNAQAGTDTTAQLAARLNEININTQASIDAKEREADELKATAQREITDHEQFQQRIKEIDETIALEKLAIVKQGAVDIDNATKESNDQRIQNLLAQKQLEIEASDPEGTVDLQRQFLELQEQQEIASAEKTGKSVELIRRKYAKLFNQIDQDRANASLQITSDLLGAVGGVLKKNSSEYKIIASAQALIDTYLGAQKAFTSQFVPGDPTSLLRAVAAAAAATIKGLANVSAINSVSFLEGGEDNYTGFTGDGNPYDVSVTHSTPRRTVHKKEYIIPHGVLALPHVASFVSNVIEPTRLRKTNFTNRVSMAGGGFSDTFFVANAGNNVSSEESITATVEATVNTMMRNFPAIKVSVEDINDGVGRVAMVEQRANQLI
jgi:hypothetical protein